MSRTDYLYVIRPPGQFVGPDEATSCVYVGQAISPLRAYSHLSGSHNAGVNALVGECLATGRLPDVRFCRLASPSFGDLAVMESTIIFLHQIDHRFGSLNRTRGPSLFQPQRVVPPHQHDSSARETAKPQDYEYAVHLCLTLQRGRFTTVNVTAVSTGTPCGCVGSEAMSEHRQLVCFESAELRSPKNVRLLVGLLYEELGYTAGGHASDAQGAGDSAGTTRGLWQPPEGIDHGSPANELTDDGRRYFVVKIHEDELDGRAGIALDSTVEVVWKRASRYWEKATTLHEGKGTTTTVWRRFEEDGYQGTYTLVATVGGRRRLTLATWTDCTLAVEDSKLVFSKDADGADFPRPDLRLAVPPLFDVGEEVLTTRRGSFATVGPLPQAESRSDSLRAELHVQHPLAAAELRYAKAARDLCCPKDVKDACVGTISIETTRQLLDAPATQEAATARVLLDAAPMLKEWLADQGVSAPGAGA